MGSTQPPAPRDGDLYMGPQGELLVTMDGELQRPTPEYIAQLGVHVELEGSIDYATPQASPADFYLIAPPGLREGKVSMRLGARAVSDTEVYGLVWHPTYTCFIEWEVDRINESGDWVFKVYHDCVPDQPFATCLVTEEGKDHAWGAGSDVTSDMACEIAIKHVGQMLLLARNLLPQPSA